MAYELIKVSELPELTTPSDPNVVPIQDGDYLKRISFQNLKESLTGDIADDLEAETQAREQAIQDEAQARENADNAILADLAAEYDATATYAVGDYVIHEGQLYRCTTAIETAEAWTASHWTAVAMGDEVGDLKNAFELEEKAVNNIGKSLEAKWEIPLVWENGQLSQGQPAVGNNNQRTVNFVDVRDIGYQNVVAENDVNSIYMYISQYDSSYTFLKTDSKGKGSLSPSDPNTAFIKLYTYSETVPQAQQSSHIKLYALNSNSYSKRISNLIQNYSGKIIAEQGYFAITDGAATSSDNWCRTIAEINRNALFRTSSIKMFLLAFDWESGAYIGTWNNSAFSTTYNQDAYLYEIDFAKWSEAYPAYIFKVDFYNGGSALTPSGVLSDLTILLSSEAKIEEIKDSEIVNTSVIYEHGEVTPVENSYNRPSGTPKNRARVKQEYLQKVPTGATSARVTINSASLHSGKYKVGFAFYTSGYEQILASVIGWFTGNASQIVSIPENAKYFMLYYASVNSAVDIVIDEIRTGENSIVFDTSDVNYAKLLVNNVYVLQKQMSEEQKHVYANSNNFIISINHRGYSTDAPENTLPAYIMSKKKGFEYAECDVQFTSDGVPVLLHDLTINRTARNADGTELSSTINIADITYQEASQYDYGIWKAAKWAGTEIPTFREFIVECKKLSLHPVIELKDVNDGTYWTDARIKLIADTINEIGIGEYVSFISFSVSALQKIGVYFPKAMLGLGLEGSYTSENFASLITKAETLQNDKRLVTTTVSYNSMNDTFYGMLSTAGIKPILWTVNNPTVALEINDTAIGVLSDILNVGNLMREAEFDSLP